jgi:hypothetical protein
MWTLSIFMAMSRSSPIRACVRGSTRGSYIADHAVADEDLALSDLFQAGQAAQGGGITTDGRAHQDGELFVGNLDVQIVDGCHIAESFGDVIVGYTSDTVVPFAS